jgi:hypothetical protein
VGGLVARPCQDSFPMPGGHEFNSCGVHTNFSIQSMEGCHMASHDWAMWHHTIIPKICHMSKYDSSICQPSTSQSTCQHICHITVWSYILYGHMSHQQCTKCTDCTVSKILPVWQNEQKAISFSYDACLSPFKLC